MSDKRYHTRMHEILAKPGEPPLKSGEMFALNTDPDDMDYYLTDEGDMFLRYGTANKTVRMAHADEVLDAINHGITRKPRLTDKQIAQLKGLMAFDMRWLTKDKNGDCWANKAIPKKGNCVWKCDGRWTIVSDTTEISSLVSWEDTEPLDIVQTLRDAGVEVEE